MDCKQCRAKLFFVLDVVDLFQLDYLPLLKHFHRHRFGSDLRQIYLPESASSPEIYRATLLGNGSAESSRLNEGHGNVTDVLNQHRSYGGFVFRICT